MGSWTVNFASFVDMLTSRGKVSLSKKGFSFNLISGVSADVVKELPSLTVVDPNETVSPVFEFEVYIKLLLLLPL